MSSMNLVVGSCQGPWSDEANDCRDVSQETEKEKMKLHGDDSALLTGETEIENGPLAVTFSL